MPERSPSEIFTFPTRDFSSIENDIMGLEVLPTYVSTAGIFYSVTHKFDSRFSFLIELRCLITNVHNYS